MQNPDVFTIRLSENIDQVCLKSAQQFRHNNSLKKCFGLVLVVNKTNLAMLKKPLYIISGFPIYLFLDPLIRLCIAVMASGSIYPLDIIKSIIDKDLQLGNISFFCAMCSNCSQESIQNSLMTRRFIELSHFLSTLSIL